MSTSINDVVFGIYRTLEDRHEKLLQNVRKELSFRRKLKKAVKSPVLAFRKLYRYFFGNDYEKLCTRKNKEWNISLSKPNVFIPTSKKFPSAKIAVYTCITGGYDEVKDPFYIDDTIDYYAVTDSVEFTDGGGGMEIYSFASRAS